MRRRLVAVVFVALANNNLLHAAAGAAVPSGSPSWHDVLTFLGQSRERFVIVNAKNGLGNRLRALASAMSVADYLGRPMLLIWARDAHLDCGIDQLFSRPLPFRVHEAEIPHASLNRTLFQTFNYMRPEPGAVKDEEVHVDANRHLYFRSAFVMNHPWGDWSSGGPQRQILRLHPCEEVCMTARCGTRTNLHTQSDLVLLDY
jgi:hypothetical protein